MAAKAKGTIKAASMKAELEFDFATPRQAKQAAAILQQDSRSRAQAKLSVKGKTLHARVEASDFTALRASVTSLLRELRVVVDSLDTLNKNPRPDVETRTIPDD